ncbi:putative dihydrodipicolinate synthase [Aspergillus sclerotioniger CBS 115572]|uniref:Putative dihydrodipicolinate synthase n=1 Tax=Aspergillus sclerotioniger CBS 115572 TaxID=1450535 RepID=A0A317WD79_9EURO|nr:putative dihydrodipicolinate synthase [Aspergillus sclerotioniger CBS 115572]PWY83885.1 putative dihydrodipicolinate synthase [Aspergillus sclerotioniger CBS 115572]
MAPGKTRTLKPGVYAPLPTFFDDNQELDYGSYKKHLLNLATRGMVPVCAGSLGEAVHLSFDERTSLIRFIRATLDEAGLNETPIIAGVGGLSTRETITLARAAAEAGADAGMVILPAYYAASLNTDHSQIIQYYVDICDASPIPILLYNFPSNAGGLDMSSSTIQSIMERSPNLCGHPKLLRLTSALKANPELNASRAFPFLLLDGLIADLTPWMQSGGHGTVSGIPNFAPATAMRLWELVNLKEPSGEEVIERERLQGVVGRADVVAYVLNKVHGYGKDPRRPLLPLGEDEGEEFLGALGELLEVEREISARG